MYKPQNPENMNQTRHNFVAYVSIVLGSAAIVVNPLTIGLFLELQTTQVAYILILDFCIAMICIFCYLYFIAYRILFFIGFLITLLFLPFVMTFSELSLTYIRLAYGHKWNGVEFENLHEPDSSLGWRPIPNAVARHYDPRKFINVLYYFDDKGRKTIQQNPSNAQTIHFFGDSFVFGAGVTNQDTALNLLAKKINDKFNILNYGVIGYGFDQMLVRLRTYSDEIQSGDFVVFAPLSIDVYRSMESKGHLCNLTIGDHIKQKKVRSVLTFDGGEWRIVDLRQACNLVETLLLNSILPVGNIYKQSYRSEFREKRIFGHVDTVLTEAARITQDRGAQFFLLFLVTADECREHKFSADVHQLTIPFESILPYCPDDADELNMLHLPNDSHWSVEGNRWAAIALERVLRTELFDRNYSTHP